MRLDRIKLAGFKSFVDPTTILFPSNLIGVVGPNGCGKSNIIDAVRWVMGESSAKQLRTDSIADVIFNGSTQRKPIGQASVELIFDNQDGSLGGEYAQYSQIAIRRLVTRDGQSNYYLNGTRCRRKDITDVFLGTGLGPRSYSIIEQGMITQVIEAKPDELRAYLEEVAGISKYKDRRHETEKRIKATYDNLSRINDIIEELDKQLQHLKRQARAAERYKFLKEQERLLRAQLLALKWQTIDYDLGNFNLIVSKQETLLESHVAALRHIETEIEKLQADKTDFSDDYNETQGGYYNVGSEITRLEQAIEHHKERKEQLQEDLQQTESSLQEASHGLSDDRLRVTELDQNIVKVEPQLEMMKERTNHSQEELGIAEQAMQAWETEWDVFNDEASHFAKTVHVEQTRIQHFEQQQDNAQKRLTRINEDKGQLDIQPLEEALSLLTQEIEQANSARSAQQLALDNVIDSISQQRNKNKELDKEHNLLREKLHDIYGTKASLDALQQAALGQKNDKVVEWLDHHQLKGQLRLGQHIQVDTGWERAVEMVLGSSLEAVCVENIDAVSHLLASFNEGALSFLDINQATLSTASRDRVLLSSKVHSKWPVSGLLNGIYVADSLSDALKLRALLSSDESVITTDGVWMGGNWLRLSKDADAKVGLIEREKELTLLQQTIQTTEEQEKATEQALNEGWAKLANLEKMRERLQVTYSQLESEYANGNAKLQVLQSQIEHMLQREAHLNSEHDDHQQSFEQLSEDMLLAQQKLQDAKQAMDEQNASRDRLLTQRDELRNVLNEARSKVSFDQNELHEIELQYQLATTQLAGLRQSIDRTERQVVLLRDHHQQITESLSQGDSPVGDLKSDLESALEKRLEIEKSLNAAKQKLDNLESELRGLQNNRHQAEETLEQTRHALEEQRLQGQTLSVRRTTLEEQLTESSFELTTLISEMPDDATEEKWQEEIERNDVRISRLGPINLAAIDEFEQLSERKTYLDTQQADLHEALQTLQNAIHKIDRETRQRFKETFDIVNENFKKIFPRVFGGGEAYLEMTGDDLLSTGISLMAKPPGKHIATIHQLSGGEKALTAIALVFALFQLNPSPFCMLDEVDAPLDDANVGRFCNLVKEMAKTVQFIFVSHNKVAIEMAKQLLGVTMHEPGVSRIVAVDIDEAFAMSKE